MQSIVAPPSGSARLWYDDRDIPFLREDVKDQAEILSMNAQTLRALLDAGFDPDAAVRAVEANDLVLLAGEHSGLFSVQLQPPMPDGPEPVAAPPAPKALPAAS
jgi:hypothetical protein